MTDIVDQQTRSRMMSGIRGKNTKPELALRRALHAAVSASGFIPARFMVGRTLSFRSTAPWSSSTAASGIVTRAVATPPPQRPGRSSGRRSLTRTSLGTAPFVQNSSKTDGEWRRCGSAHCGSRIRLALQLIVSRPGCSRGRSAWRSVKAIYCKAGSSLRIGNAALNPPRATEIVRFRFLLDARP